MGFSDIIEFHGTSVVQDINNEKNGKIQQKKNSAGQKLYDS